jgi:hypothetical protein
MKKTLTIMTLLAGAVSVYSQGSVSIDAYTSGVGPIQVFGVQTTGNNATVSYGGFTVSEEQGNTANPSYANSPGTTVYASGVVLGPGFDVQALAAPGQGDALSTLLPVGTVVTTWNAGPGTAASGAVGSWNTTQDVSIPLATEASGATIAIAAWQATGTAGAAGSLAAAQLDGYAWGISAVVNTAVATGKDTPPFLPAGLTDFSLGSTPEPSTIALGVIGASAFLFRRRK